jgi:hypothetical protein
LTATQIHAHTRTLTQWLTHTHTRTLTQWLTHTHTRTLTQWLTHTHTRTQAIQHGNAAAARLLYENGARLSKDKADDFLFAAAAEGDCSLLEILRE